MGAPFVVNMPDAVIANNGTDSNIIPLVKLDAVFTPAGGDVTLQFNSAGFFRAS